LANIKLVLKKGFWYTLSNLKSYMKKILLNFLLPILVLAMTFGIQLGHTQAAATFPSGSLVNDNDTVYIVRGTQKVGFTTWQSFVDLGYNPNNIVKGDTSSYSPSTFFAVDNAAHPWGSWLSSNGTIYYSTSSGLIGVPNQEIFTSNGGQWSYVVSANKYDLATINANSVLTDNDSRVYSGSTQNPPVACPLTSGSPAAGCNSPWTTTAPSTNTPTTSTNAPTITSIDPNSGPIGTLIEITGTGFSDLNLNYQDQGNGIDNGGIWLTNGTVWADSDSTATIKGDTDILATIVGATCPGEENICSSNYSSTLTPGTYSLEVVTPNGTSNAVNFTVTAGTVVTAPTNTSGLNVSESVKNITTNTNGLTETTTADDSPVTNAYITANTGDQLQFTITIVNNSGHSISNLVISNSVAPGTIQFETGQGAPPTTIASLPIGTSNFSYAGTVTASTGTIITESNTFDDSISNIPYTSSSIYVEALQPGQTAAEALRDVQRYGDTVDISNMLYVYNETQGSYPKTLNQMVPLWIPSLPVAPEPADGACTEAQNTYTYTPVLSSTGVAIDYSLTYCLGYPITAGAITAGVHTYTSSNSN
jgi:hypothetical protein